MSQWTLSAVLTAAKDYLVKNDLTSPQLEAELLLAHSLQLSRVELYVQYDRPLNEAEREKYKGLLRDRCSGKPLQYITGNQAFRRLNLRVGPGVFIPRPETELLVEKAIEEIAKYERSQEEPLAIVDLGAGSGAICLSLAQELTGVHIWAVDISTQSLAVAEANAIAHGLEDKVTFLCGDLYSALPPPASKKYDFIIANPPYIPSGEIEGLQSEVRDHEPREALDGGSTGDVIYQRIISQASKYIKDRGAVAFEVGIDQSETVSERLANAGFTKVDVYKDYNGIKRIVIGRKTSRS